MYYFDSTDVFAVNPKASIRVKEIGRDRTPIVIVDNFYRHPRRVRALVLATPAPSYKAAPGTRNFIDYRDCRQQLALFGGSAEYIAILSAIIRMTYRRRVEINSMFTTNVFQLIKAQPPNSTAFPHQDVCSSQEQAARGVQLRLFSAVLYLNSPSECRGGTAFFRHRGTKREAFVRAPRAAVRLWNVIYRDGHNIDYGQNYWHETWEDDWIRYYTAPMKFNRLVLFPSQLFHGAWHEPNWFASHPRLTQVMFAVPAPPGGRPRGVRPRRRST